MGGNLFWVYILRSLRNGKLYVGHTDDLSRRLTEHNEGRGGRFTREQGPWELRHSEEHPDRASAARRERFLKGVAGSREKKRLAGVPVQHGGPYGAVDPAVAQASPGLD
jgi:predicted GIY-YIG superfamily endonuclease